jgi:hypothetical protein
VPRRINQLQNASTEVALADSDCPSFGSIGLKTHAMNLRVVGRVVTGVSVIRAPVGRVTDGTRLVAIDENSMCTIRYLIYPVRPLNLLVRAALCNTLCETIAVKN